MTDLARKATITALLFVIVALAPVKPWMAISLLPLWLGLVWEWF